MSGMMMMEPVAKVEVAPGARVELKPGSYHLMLIGLKRALDAGADRHPHAAVRAGRRAHDAREVR